MLARQHAAATQHAQCISFARKMGIVTVRRARMRSVGSACGLNVLMVIVRAGKAWHPVRHRLLSQSRVSASPTIHSVRGSVPRDILQLFLLFLCLSFTVGANAKSSRATLSLTQQNATVWEFDFSSSLLFPTIATVRINVVAEEGFPIAVARPPRGSKVTVETNIPITGTITVDVDSSVSDAGFL
mmetsp:Transcript_12168/g.17611  ORF Transcript_12168/g.17611 Transcript_12168/m.17611 type:complete len:185 (+) Transcript_12168:1375-1929(+)